MTFGETFLYVIDRFIVLAGVVVVLLLLFALIPYLSWKIANRRYAKHSKLSHKACTVYEGRFRFKLAIRTVDGRSTVTVINTGGHFPALSYDCDYDEGLRLYYTLKHKAPMGELIQYINRMTYRPKRKP